jgi:hypothetical protein
LGRGFVRVIAALSVSSVWATSKTDLWQAGVSFYSEGGDYGTGSNVSTVYMPFSLRRYFQPGDLELVVPFISVTSEGQVVVVEGVPNGLGRGSTTTTTVTRVNHSGIGDMLLKGRYYAIPEGNLIPSVDATAKIKFPTASRSDDLGTGEFDEGFGLEFTKTIQKRYLALADIGYTFIGSPPGTHLNNEWSYSLGAGYYFLPENLLGTFSYEESAAIVPGDPNPKDLLWEVQYRLNREWKILGGIQAGLSESTADYGFNIGVRRKF